MYPQMLLAALLRHSQSMMASDEHEGTMLSQQSGFPPASAACQAQKLTW